MSEATIEPIRLTRRSAVTGLLGLAALAFSGCGRSATGDSKEAPAMKTGAPSDARKAAMTVYRDPSCGCCTAWAGIAREAGYEVSVIDHPDMPSIKRQYGVPDALLSCHTAIVGGYAVEGHVPIEDVARLLAERPADIRGIAVPGMPLGSPGMEVPDGTVQPFEVMAFGADGQVRPFRA